MSGNNRILRQGTIPEKNKKEERGMGEEDGRV
jgi:hypothetical protein